MRAPQRSLKDWGKQKWRTKSGKKSSETGEQALSPEAAIVADAGRVCCHYEGEAQGETPGQTVLGKQPKSIMKKTRRFR